MQVDEIECSEMYRAKGKEHELQVTAIKKKARKISYFIYIYVYTHWDAYN